VANRVPACGLADQGIQTSAQLHWNLLTPALIEQAVARGEGVLAKDGPLVVKTGKHTGRSAKDKFIVRDAETESTIWWDNNKSMTSDHFAALKGDFLAELAKKETLFVADLYGGSQPEHRVRVRVINELAWHNLFIRTLLVRPEAGDLPGFDPEFTIIDLPSFRADPERHGCRSETVIAVNLTEKMILIGGTAYAGEMKKSVFGVLNYILPAEGVMHQAVRHCARECGSRPRHPRTGPRR
jgi:phosphoenolpyruvate carboxykinase (ATP)